MAAPQKKGLDYFPHDCNLDHKIDIVEARFGLIGYGVYFKLLETIYSQGEALNVNEDFWLVFFAKKCQIDYDKGLEIVKFLVQKDLFDRSKFEQGVLTSNGIKSRYTEATKRRKPLSVPSIAQNEVNANINQVNVNINEVNERIYGQSKVKEIYNTNTIDESQNFEKIGIKIGDFTSESLAFQLRQKTPQKFQSFQKKHSANWEKVLNNFIEFHENSLKPNFEEIAKHLLNYNFLGEEKNTKEKNVAPKKENGAYQNKNLPTPNRIQDL